MKSRKGRPKLDDDSAVNEALWRLAEILFEISAAVDVNGKDAPKKSYNKEVDDG